VNQRLTLLDELVGDLRPFMHGLRTARFGGFGRAVVQRVPVASGNGTRLNA